MNYRDKQFLEEKYVEEGMTQLEISEITDVSRQAIGYWIDRYSLNRFDKEACNSCGEEYMRLGAHWRASNCNYPEISDRDLSMIKGILMGDGTIDFSSTLPAIKIEMVNLEYINYVSDRLGNLCSGPTLLKYREEAFMENKMYSIRIRCNPQLNEFNRWHTGKRKRYPETLNLNSEILRHWYCCDGCLVIGDAGRYVTISCYNEKDRKEFIESLFDDIGFSVNMNGRIIQFPSKDTDEVLDYMGDPPPGFGYKWAGTRKEWEERKKGTSEPYTQTEDDSL